jgi:hypothetical protein
MVRTLGRGLLLAVVLLAGCSSPADPPDQPDPREHHARMVGLWAVEQPFHAAYEITYYDLAADGALTTGPSDPADCTGHLARHCVTGSVANCEPAETGGWCEGTVTCVFGDAWWSRGPSTLVIAGDCSDGAAREIVIALSEDSTGNSSFGGAGGTLMTVGGEAGWSHDNWAWSFRKCPAGTGVANCFPE